SAGRRPPTRAPGRPRSAGPSSAPARPPDALEREQGVCLLGQVPDGPAEERLVLPRRRSHGRPGRRRLTGGVPAETALDIGRSFTFARDTSPRAGHEGL